MKRLLCSTALVSVLAGSANADTICGINTDTVLKWPGYAGKQNVWFDKGEHFFKYFSIYNGKILTSKHFKVFKESCQKSSVLVINNTENKKSKSVVSGINPPIIISEPIIDISEPNEDNLPPVLLPGPTNPGSDLSGNLIQFPDSPLFLSDLFEDDDEFIGYINT
ncbi:hypothetical protein N8390_10615 [Amylibacter sp.]|nr:hypothetical protein [Amylibacter sp.]